MSLSALTQQSNEVGNKYDEDKPRWDLLPIKPATEIIRVLTFGSRKYGDNNWKHVESPKRRYYAAALRHLTAWADGERHDPESGYHHLAHAGCCILFLLFFELTEEKIYE